MTPPTYPMRPLNGGKFRRHSKPGDVWYYEPKYNGWRCLVHLPSGECFNRHGKKLSVASDFQPAIDLLKVKFDRFEGWLDCEGLLRRHKIGLGTLIVFDALLDTPIEQRHTWLRDQVCNVHNWVEKPTAMNVYTPIWNPSTFSYLQSFWDGMQETNKEFGCEFYEGFVAKRGGSRYTFQLEDSNRSTLDWVKHRWRY